MKTELNTRIEKYGVLAAAAGAATVGLGASAAIVASGVQNVAVDDTAPVGIDIDADTFDDIQFNVGVIGANAFVSLGAGAGTDGAATYASPVGGYPYASNLAAGAAIDSTLSFNVGNGATFIYGSNGAFAPPNGAGFVGYTFAAGDGAGGFTQVFGWLELANVTGTGLTVVQWAYETDGTGIQAGAVPEPGSLALLAMGAVGVMSRRSRKAVRDAA